jgi:DNA-binding transcriptional LysR family regulator
MSVPPITIEALTVIDAIEQRGSYAAAAEQLNKVPSALSYVVQKLEQQLQVTIFQKQGRRSMLTPAGKHLVREGRQILTAIEQLSDKTKNIANGWEPKLNIAIDSILDSAPIFAVLNQFLLEHPLLEIDISEEVMNGAWEALVEDKVDLLIGAPAPIPQQKGIHAVKIATFERVFVVSKHHELAHAKQPLTNTQIAEHRTVVVHDSAQTYIPWTAGILAESKYFYVPTIEYKIKAQLAGIGCGFLPKTRIQAYLDSGELIALSIDSPHEPRDIYMAYKLVNQGRALKKIRELLLNAHL